MTMDYEEKTCVTAGELREAGIPVPEHIPDCAWIPRRALVPKLVDVSEGEEQGVVNITTRVEFAEPFRWVEGTFTVSSELDKKEI